MPPGISRATGRLASRFPGAEFPWHEPGGRGLPAPRRGLQLTAPDLEGGAGGEGPTEGLSSLSGALGASVFFSVKWRETGAKERGLPRAE